MIVLLAFFGKKRKKVFLVEDVNGLSQIGVCYGLSAVIRGLFSFPVSLRLRRSLFLYDRLAHVYCFYFHTFIIALSGEKTNGILTAYIIY